MEVQHHRSLGARIMTVTATLILAVLFAAPMGGVTALHADRGVAAPVPVTAPQAIPLSQAVVINEIRPNPGGSPEWVELLNASRLENPVFLPVVVSNRSSSDLPAAAPAVAGFSTDLDGWELSNESGGSFSLPDALPPVPYGAFVIIYFDGTGPANNDYDFSDNLAQLHTPPGVTDFFGDNQGQAALYTSSSHNAATIRAFTAWGGFPGVTASNAEQAGIWQPAWYVESQSAGGDRLVQTTGNFSFGIVPGAAAADRASWAAYAGTESTPGERNGLPAPKWTPTGDTTKMDSNEFAIGWQAIPGADSYEFQMDDDPAFGSPAVAVVTEDPFYVPATNPQATQGTSPQDAGAIAPPALTPGIYYWRVRALQGVQFVGVWSISRLVELFAVPFCTEVTLTMPWQLQHSDTRMLQLDGSPETGKWAWDAPNEEDGEPVRGEPQGDNYCVRASVSMINSYYGGALSQDRISYHVLEEWSGNTESDANDGVPENDLGYGRGMVYPDEEDEALSWALGTPITAIGGKPSFNQFKTWLDEGRAIMMRNPGHMMAVNGYRTCLDGTQWIHVMDPWNAPRWQDYTTQSMNGVWPGPAGVAGAPGVRSDEATIWTDTDGDGIVDFDETNRFGTGIMDSDSDDDGVLDKADIREYVFTNAGVYSKRNPDLDSDELRKERDPDNDNDGALDGCEDNNRNGKYEAASGESNNFSAADTRTCTGARLAVNWAEMDFDTYIQQRNFQIRNTGSGTLNWSINTAAFPSWLGLATPNSGSLSAGAETTVLVNVNWSGLSVGKRLHSIAVTSNGGSATVLALMQVAPTASFGAADYDSGWQKLGLDTARTLTHNLGGNPEDYLVRMEFRTADGNGINTRYLGGADFGTSPPAGHEPNDRVGAYWRSLTSSTITIYRRPEDSFAPEIRIRIWRAPAPQYDSGWRSLGLDRARTLAHQLRGRGDFYLVDLEYKATDVNGINARYFGGADFGSKPPAGQAENDRVGAYWRSLDGRIIALYRRPEDSYAVQARIRLWRMETPDYDSGWQAINQDQARTLAHNLGGNAENYIVDVLYNTGTGTFEGINARYFGGMDVGTRPSSGTSVDDRVGAYWRTLTNSSITVYRRPQDIYAPQMRVRIWRP